MNQEYLTIYLVVCFWRQIPDKCIAISDWIPLETSLLAVFRILPDAWTACNPCGPRLSPDEAWFYIFIFGFVIDYRANGILSRCTRKKRGVVIVLGLTIDERTIAFIVATVCACVVCDFKRFSLFSYMCGAR